MTETFSRTERLFGRDAMQKLKEARVLVFGVGGVGGFVAEALARSGVGAISLCDHDTVSESNINRQLIALHSTVGRRKVDVMKDRIADISPDCEVKTFPLFFTPETADTFDFSEYDYIIDAIDSVSGKLAIIEKAKAAGTPVISAMGAGNKLDPTSFRVTDISKTSVCPLARVMRTELKKRGISHVKVVFSDEPARPSTEKDPVTGKPVPASCAFVPSVAGLILAGEVLKDLGRF